MAASDQTVSTEVLSAQTEDGSFSGLKPRADTPPASAIGNQIGKYWMRRLINIIENAGFTVSVDDLLLHRQSVVITMKDLIRGKFSHTTGPISVTSADGRFVVGDGCHRLLQALLVGKTRFRAKIDSRYATEFGIAPDKLWTPDVSSPTLGLEALGFSPEDIASVREALAARAA